MSHCMFIIDGRDTKDKRHKNIKFFLNGSLIYVNFSFILISFQTILISLENN